MNSISRIQQVLKAVPRRAFEQSVAQHQGDKHVKKFTCWDQLVAMLYVQLAGADSLRQLEAGFNPQVNHHYHLATGCVRRTTLSDANKKRSPLIFAQLLQALIEQAGRSARAQREELLYLMDATTVDLPGRGCEALRGHASTRGNHGIKLHVLLDARNAAVAAASTTPANVNDITQGRKIAIEPGATYVFDKGYCNYNWWHSIDQKGARWVTRWRRDAALNVVSEQAVDPDQSEILRDSIVAFALRTPRGGHRNSYSGPVRRIEVARPDAAPLVLATNDLVSAPQDIALLYKQRWQIELFFKWIKQHLQIGRFLGSNENAVRIQLLTALIAYMLVLILKKATQFKGSLWMLLAQLRGCLFQRPQTERTYWRRRQAQQARIATIQKPLFL
jgi:putative transposase